MEPLGQVRSMFFSVYDYIYQKLLHGLEFLASKKYNIDLSNEFERSISYLFVAKSPRPWNDFRISNYGSK